MARSREAAAGNGAAVVVGAGISGLSTALALLEAARWPCVRLLADVFSPDTTSDVAGGYAERHGCVRPDRGATLSGHGRRVPCSLWLPPDPPSSRDAEAALQHRRTLEWARATAAYWRALADVPDAGIAPCRGRIGARHGMLQWRARRALIGMVCAQAS